MTLSSCKNIGFRRMICHQLIPPVINLLTFLFLLLAVDMRSISFYVQTVLSS